MFFQFRLYVLIYTFKSTLKSINQLVTVCPLSSDFRLLNGGGERDRTDGLLRARQALSQLSYTPIQRTDYRGQRTDYQGALRQIKLSSVLWRLSSDMVGLGGLEPPTSRLSGVRSNQLSYRPIQNTEDRGQMTV